MVCRSRAIPATNARIFVAQMEDHKRANALLPGYRTAKKQRPGHPGPFRQANQTGEPLFFLVRLLFRRRQPFQAFEQFFFGHPLGRHLGVVGVDGRTWSANERHR